MPPLPKIIIVVGPTASGKSACGIEIARVFDGEVICVDSRTVYRGMDVGTAKPAEISRPAQTRGCSVLGTGGRALLRTPPTRSAGRPRFGGGPSRPRLRELPGQNTLESVRVQRVPHWGLDLVEPDEDYTVAMFQEYAQEKIGEIIARGKLPVLVGGTGLWMDAVVDNLSLPAVPPGAKLRAELETKGLDELAREYLELDPDGADVVDLKNKRRLIRAIEVCRATGRPFSELRQKGAKLYDALWLGMDVPRDELDTRINARVDEMMGQGLVEEVRRLKDEYGCNIPSMSGIGYRELCEFFEKNCHDVTISSMFKGGSGDVDTSKEVQEVIETIKTNTRRFARRQMTWFKRREEIVWVKEREEALKEVERFLKQNIRA